MSANQARLPVAAMARVLGVSKAGFYAWLHRLPSAHVVADAALRGVVAWASWRLLGWVVAAVASLVLVGWLASGLVLWWDTGAIAAARTEKRQLQAGVAEMQARWEDWAKMGVLGKMERCGPKRRPCMRVDEGAGAFQADGHADYRVIQGY